MGVIINDFEVVTDAPPADADATPPEGAASQEPSSGPTASDLLQVTRHQERRAGRLWAH